jgi:pSer/pThr/pTyr-binding forkhead associated (FHA) protein
LEDNSIICIGKTFIVCSLKDTNLKLEIMSNGQNYDPVYICNNVFSNLQPSRTAYKIGRSNECEVVIRDVLISKVQCLIQYNKTVGWTIVDGYLNKKRNLVNSTNGTWMYISNEKPLVDELTFKHGRYIFVINFE